MATTVYGSSAAAYAFALGLRSSGFLERTLKTGAASHHRGSTKVPADEAEKQRPNDFSHSTIASMKAASISG